MSYVHGKVTAGVEGVAVEMIQQRHHEAAPVNRGIRASKQCLRLNSSRNRIFSACAAIKGEEVCELEHGQCLNATQRCLQRAKKPTWSLRSKLLVYDNSKNSSNHYTASPSNTVTTSCGPFFPPKISNTRASVPSKDSEPVSAAVSNPRPYQFV